jgi:hypothetical protein
MQEIDTETVARSRLFVDSRQAALAGAKAAAIARERTRELGLGREVEP